MEMTFSQKTAAVAALSRAAKAAGSVSALAEAVGVSRRLFYYWKDSGIVPPEHLDAIERATSGKITRHQLRPDLYPEPDPA